MGKIIFYIGSYYRELWNILKRELPRKTYSGISGNPRRRMSFIYISFTYRGYGQIVLEGWELDNIRLSS